MPNPFVDSLVHDSIIVQIPLLHGQINNKLEKVLSIFDQHRKAGFNRQVLTLEEDIYSDDSDMAMSIVLIRLICLSMPTRSDSRNSPNGTTMRWRTVMIYVFGVPRI